MVGSGAEVVRDGDPCRLPTRIDAHVQKIMLRWRKLNELSENLRFNTWFYLVLEICSFKVYFLYLFKCKFFKVFQGWMGLVKDLLLPKSEKLQFAERFNLFPKDIKKDSKLNFFPGSSLTLWALQWLAVTLVFVGVGVPCVYPWVESVRNNSESWLWIFCSIWDMTV